MEAQINSTSKDIHGTKVGQRLYVSTSPEPVQMFKSKYIEVLSRTHFLLIPLIYLPLAALAIYQAGLSLLNLEIVGAGFAFWTFSEYVLHRFFFHWTPPGKIGARLHFIYHGVHHDFPNDRMRLVFAPILGLPLTYLHFWAFKSVLGLPNAYPFFAGFITGYVLYDMMHYALHHINIKGGYWQKMKENHMRHHFADPEKGFGVSSPVWDYVFDTVLGKK